MMNSRRANNIRFLKVLFYFVLIFHPFIFLNFYLAGNWYSFFHDYTVGMFFGITGYCWLCAALILSGRVKLFDILIGQDRVIRVHGYIASSGIVFGIIHYFIKKTYVESLSLQPSAGFSALILFTLIMFITFLYMVEKPVVPVPGFAGLKKIINKAAGIDYSKARIIHNFFPLAHVFLIVHVLLAYSTSENACRISAMGFYGAAAVALYFYHLLFRKIMKPRKLFSVSGVEDLSSSVVRIRLSQESPVHERFIFRSGQFACFRFFSRVVASEEHPFTVSSSPAESDISVTVKRGGDYTMKLSSLEPGDRAAVDGPYGLFSPLPDGRQKIFIAGGIGITPFLSVLRDWEIKGLSFSSTLLWSVRFENELIDLAFLKRVEEWNPSFNLRIFITGDESDTYSNRRIGVDDIKGAIYSGALKETDAYICGPSPFMDSVKKMLKKTGVPGRNIRLERFSS